MRTSGWCAGLVGLLGCAADLTAPGAGDIACTRMAQCPAGMVCRLNVQRCVSTSFDETPPALVEPAVVTPPLGTMGTAFTVVLRFDQSLAAPPIATVRGTGRALDEIDASAAGDRYTLEYVGRGDEPTPAEIDVIAIGVRGAEAQLDGGRLMFDFVPAVVMSFDWVAPPAVAPSDGLLEVSGLTEPDARIGAAELVSMTTGPLITLDVVGVIETVGGPSVLRLSGEVDLARASWTGSDDVRVELQVLDPAGNVTDTQTPWLSVDADPPETTLTSTPVAASNELRALFTFTSPSADLQGFECDLDGAGFEPCQSPFDRFVHSEGSHTFEVRAVDSSGLVDPTPDAHTWQETRRWAGTINAGCAIASDRSLWCWGRDVAGELGLGFVGGIVLRPMRVGTENDWLTTATRGTGTCGIREEGGLNGLWCWGKNHPLLSLGAPYTVPQPTGSYDWSSVRGDCALKVDGRLFCWGDNEFGRVGSTTFSDVFEPAQVGADNDWIAFESDPYATCGIRQDGSGSSLWCWGYNSLGASGPAYPTPQLIDDTKPWFQTTTHCALEGSAGAGRLWCWGNFDPQDSTYHPLTQIGVADDWREVLGGGHRWVEPCGLKQDGSVACWVQQSQLMVDPGSGIDDDYVRAMTVPSIALLTPAFESVWAPVQVSAAVGTWCGFEASMGLYCWGRLGIVADPLRGFVQASPHPLWKDVTAGTLTVCAVRDEADAALECWGDLSRPVLGADEAVLSPQAVGSLTGWEQLRLMGFPPEVWGIRTVGTERQLWSWSGDPTSALQYGSDGDWLSLAAGARHVCGIRDAPGAPTLWCWGSNGFGVLGLPGGLPRATPEQVGVGQAYEIGWTSVAASSTTTCGIRQEGVERQLYCWGEFNEVPTRVGSGTDWHTIATGWLSKCGIRGSLPGELWCWGRGSLVPDGSGVDQTQPTRIGADADWVDVSLSSEGGCAVKDDRTLWCWGDNAGGLLGANAGPGFTLTPVEMVGLSAVEEVRVEATPCAITASGLWCWGRNDGQLGDPLAWGPRISSGPADW